MEIGLAHFMRLHGELDEVGAKNPHELMRFVECGFIRDCAEMAARASLYRKESRWGLYHHRLDFPEMNNQDWFCHVNLKKGGDGAMQLFKQPVPPYVVSLEADELKTYHKLRVSAAAEASA
jgi:succinate dehydrogenase/fumarate reductase flavoprotein subunit